MNIQPVQNETVTFGASRNTGKGHGGEIHAAGSALQGDLVVITRGPSKSEAGSGLPDKNQANGIALAVRDVAQGVERLADKIGAMKRELATIVKNFPPFPQGSEERVKLLRSYNSLRQQIESLTIPRDEPSEPVRDSTGSPPLLAAADDASLQFSFDGRKVSLAIPALPADPTNDATDGQIDDAMSLLNKAEETLASERTRIGREFYDAMDSQNFAGIFTKTNDDQVPLTDEAASSKTGTLREALAVQSQGLAADLAPFLQKL